MEPRRRFRILKELAEGAFGKVYLAEMITGDNFKSVVAIKPVSYTHLTLPTKA